MSFWLLVSACVAPGITAMCIYKMIWHRDLFRVWERGGLGLMAGGALMSIPPAVLVAPTPFDEWAAAVLRVGVLLYLAGKVWRLRHHERNNAKMAAMGRAHWAAQRRAEP